MLWVDQHRPKTLDDLSYHEMTTKRLEALVEHTATMPHLFVYGPSGAGKKTRIMALLQKIYGNGALKLKLDKRSFTTPSKRVVEVNMVSSPYHIELCPGDAGMNDRFVVQEVIKEMASNRALTSKKGVEFKIVVLQEVDRLTKQAQAALRRTMEKYASTCRLILVCNSPSKVMEPVRSRCLGIRVPAPSIDDICRVLKITADLENVTISDRLAVTLARESSRNLRRALLMLEATHVVNPGKNDESSFTTVLKTDWELYIHQLAADISREQSPQRLMAAREKLYELLVHCIPPATILKTLVKELLVNLDDSLKQEVLEWAAFYEHRMATGGSKEIFHLEAFVCKYMAIYKKYLTDMFGS